MEERDAGQYVSPPLLGVADYPLRGRTSLQLISLQLTTSYGYDSSDLPSFLHSSRATSGAVSVNFAETLRPARQRPRTYPDQCHLLPKSCWQQVASQLYGLFPDNR